MPSVPNATTLATATAVSALEAFTMGEAAVIAVTPHTVVPVARSEPSSFDSPAFWEAQGM
jgi:hypothetical protein